VAEKQVLQRHNTSLFVLVFTPAW